MPAKRGYPTAGLVVLVIILTLMYAQAIMSDTRNGKLVRSMDCPDIDAVDVSLEERCKIEQVIRDYKNKRTINKSQSKRLTNAVILGALRGGLGGAVLGGEAGILPGMIAFGSLGGILSWSGSYLGSSKFIVLDRK